MQAMDQINLLKWKKNELCVRFAIKDWFQASGKTTKTGKQKVTRPAFSLEVFLEGRKNQEAYTVLFELFVPCVTKKKVWDIRLAQAQTKHESSRLKSLCSVSGEAFARLLLENSFERWLDIFSNHKGPVMQQRGVRQREFQSDVPTVYDKTSVTQSVKGWSAEDIVRFNTLFDLVKRDRAENPDFERHWLEARRSAQEEGGGLQRNANSNRHKRVQGCSNQITTMTLHQPQLGSQWRSPTVQLTMKRIIFH
jgi:hypothetical protein